MNVSYMITCTCRKYRIWDLNLSLVQGQTVTLSPEQVRKSLDLIHARSIGAVELLKIKRSRVSRPPAKSPKKRKTFRKRPVPSLNQTQQADGLAQEVAQRVLAGLNLNELLEQALKTAPVASEAVSRVAPSVSEVPPMEEEELTPVFIPSNLVNRDAKFEVRVESEETSNSGLDDAAKALKKRRKKKDD